MADTKPTTVKAREVSGKTSNPRDVQFPFDEAGFTTLLRKEGVRAAGRIKGDDTKLRVFLETLKVLGEHAKAKVENDKAEREATLKAKAVREEQERLRKAEDAKRELARVEDVARATLATRRRLKAEIAEGTA